VLFELATEEPGFTVDGPAEELGRRIILPPWLESRREQVEGAAAPAARSPCRLAGGPKADPFSRGISPKPPESLGEWRPTLA
jgi:hypothetical protein